MQFQVVLARGQNHFFHELADALVDELTQLGVRAGKTVGPFPAAATDTVYLLIPPHEYFRLTPESERPTAEHLRRTIFLCAEQPGSSFFERNARLIAKTDCVAFDINSTAIRYYEPYGIKVEHFQLGWTRSWAKFDPTERSADEFARRPIDVLHLGSRSQRREVMLAHSARFLADRNCRIVLGDNTAPLLDSHEDWVGEDAKWNELGQSRVLLNIHRDEEPYFEWLRVVQAIANGTVVVSDFSADTQPLRPGHHFVEARGEDLGLAASLLLRDNARCHQMSCDAYELLRDQLPMRRSVEKLVARAESLLAETTRPVAAIDANPFAEELVGVRRPEFDGWRRLLEEVDADPVLRSEAELNRALRSQKLQVEDLRNEISHLRADLGESGSIPKVRRVHSSPAYAGARPKISVITPLYNYEQYIGRTLTSVTHSDERDFELIVVDDGSTDDSLESARSWMVENPKVPALLLQHPINRRLGQARNTAIWAARGRYVFALDADNSIFRTCLSRLSDLLDRDAGASFAWGYLERHDPRFRSVGVLSTFPWEPRRFADGNYIDAMVMWRRHALIELGLYTTDADLYGWEDFELFCRLAESGGRGALAPQFVARYRSGGVSMARTTNMAGVAMTRQLVEMYPGVMGAG